MLLLALYAERSWARLRRRGIVRSVLPARLGCLGGAANPTDRGEEGTKMSVAVDRSGLVSGLRLSNASIPDSRL